MSAFDSALDTATALIGEHCCAVCALESQGIEAREVMAWLVDNTPAPQTADAVIGAFALGVLAGQALERGVER